MIAHPAMAAERMESLAAGGLRRAAVEVAAGAGGLRRAAVGVAAGGAGRRLC
jgi:hypothetical protein